MTGEQGQRVFWRVFVSFFFNSEKRTPFSKSNNFTTVNPYPESVSGGVENISSSSSDISD